MHRNANDFMGIQWIPWIHGNPCESTTFKDLAATRGNKVAYHKKPCESIGIQTKRVKTYREVCVLIGIRRNASKFEGGSEESVEVERSS